jgi:vancomycin aglycone glucosyltransferase
MRVLLSTYGSRGHVEAMVGLAVRVCAPPDCAELPARVGVPLVQVGLPVCPLVTGTTPSAGAPRRAAELVAAQFDTAATAAEGGDALLAGGVMPVGVWL